MQLTFYLAPAKTAVSEILKFLSTSKILGRFSTFHQISTFLVPLTIHYSNRAVSFLFWSSASQQEVLQLLALIGGWTFLRNLDHLYLSIESLTRFPKVSYPTYIKSINFRFLSFPVHTKNIPTRKELFIFFFSIIILLFIVRVLLKLNFSKFHNRKPITYFICCIFSPLKIEIYVFRNAF